MQEIVIVSAHSVDGFSVLSEQEKHKILVEWNDTRVDYPKHLCIHQLFEAQVEKTPHNIAVVFNEEKFTYQELNHRANKVAHHLQSLGVGTEVLVGICVERSWEMVVGNLAILKAGGAYVPLDPTYPQERLNFMVSDSQVQVLLTQEKFVAGFRESGVKTVCLDTDWELIDRQSQENPNTDVTAENLAYVIYTSGSTGTPKGVAVPHRAVNRLVCNTNYVQLDKSDRIAQASNASFDAATFEIWGALLHGAKLVIVPQNVVLSPQHFAAYIREQSISVLFLTPALFNQLASIVPQAFKDLRHLLIGGDALDPKSVKAVLRNRPPQRLLNAYGPTESTTFSCWYLVQDVAEGATNLPIGRPISNTQIYILDSKLQPVPIGTPGELYIGGDGLARGYLNRPDLTEEKFISNPFRRSRGALEQGSRGVKEDQSCSERLYKTGDLARFLPDGTIIFIGRVDNQVKIRGFRIELGEIEALLSQHPDVSQAAVIAREDIPGDKRLVAYTVLNQKSEANATILKRFLEEKLPLYMVPAVFVILDSLPLTPNGKVDRKNLPVPDRSRPDLEESFIAPSNPIEEKLALIWAELLRLEQIGVNDNFFYLGGHSLIATQMLSRVREVFTVELSFHQIFENPTIGALGQLIAQAYPEQHWQRLAIERISHEGFLPVSFAQERVYFIQQLAPESNAYQFQATLRFHGQLDVAVLQQCLNEIVLRHEILHTTYPAINGRLFQVIHPHQPIDFIAIDLQSFPENERETQAQKLVETEVQKPFDLNQLPLVRWVLFKLSDKPGTACAKGDAAKQPLREREHLLLHIEHHMVHDGWSFNVFLGELIQLYQAFSLGHPSPLPEPLLQFADFAYWQRQWVKSQEAQAQLTYWQQKLSGSSPLLELPLDRPRPTEQTYQGDQIRMELPIDLCESLRVLSRREGVTLFMTMLAAFLVMLHRYTGQDDISVGTAVANRRMREVEGLIGMMVNNLVLRNNLSGNPTFRELLARVRSCTLEAYANEDLPFDKVVEVLKPIRNLSHNPLFQVMFSFHDSPMPNLSFPGLNISLHEPIGNKSSKFDLDFLVIPRYEQSVQNGSKTGAKGITLVLEYNSDLFDAATIQRMLEQYQKLLEEILANPEQQIGKLPLLTQFEQQLLVKWNQNQREYPQDECIHQLFAEQVEQSPDAVAVEQSSQQLTYRELSDRANQLAHYLQSLGVKPETLVGICVDRSLEMIVGLLGILKAGGAYVPLDPAYPQERLADILKDTQLSILLTQERFRSQLPDYAGKTICLDTDWSVIGQYSTANPTSDVQLHNLAYIIYTSGSTGKPKGVAIEHRSLMNFVMTAIHEYGIDAGENPTGTLRERILQFASICFDTSIEEIFPTLLVGATLVLRTEQMLHSSDEFWRCCQEWQLTVLDLPTAYWHQLVAELKSQDSRIPASLRIAIVGGEEVQPSKVKHWHSSVAHLPHPPQLFNSYGPTEATVITTLHRLNSSTATSVSIGRPISNAWVYVLDRYLQPVPIGVPGELHIGGASLARGYWQRPELTAEKFIQNPFYNPKSTIQNPKLYKTGDLARFRADGTLEYLGRVDTQVKVRGFRIELGEIETVLHQHPQVFQAVVIAREDIPGQKRLVAYIVPHQSQPTTDELRHFLKQKLPNYMVPSAFVLLEALPLTPNQKVDYRALPTPDFSRSIEDKFVTHRTLVEEKLAAIWSEILRIEKIGIHDNFFELGGDSILSIQIISRANQAGIQIAPKQLFKYQTIAELAAVAGLVRSVKAEQGLVTGQIALTPIQQWFFEQELSEPNYFNQSVLLEVPPELTREQLQQIMQQLLLHHDALRLRFVWEGENCHSYTNVGFRSSTQPTRFVWEGENWQQINTTAQETVPLSVFDLSHLSPDAQQTAMNGANTELQASLNLSTGAIAQVALFQLGNDRLGRLLLIIHHLAVDGISWRILLEDLATAFQQVRCGEAIKLPLKTTSFQYWSDRLTEYGQSEKILTELDYWVSQSNFKVTALPVDYPSTTEDNTIASTATVSLSLSEEQTRALLQDVPSAYNTQINDVLLTALVQSFAQWTGEQFLLLDLEGHGREDLFEDVDLSRTVGWFTTLFPVCLQLEAVDHPGETLKSVKEQLRRIPNRGIGYGVLRYLNNNPEIRKKLQALPQVQVSFNYLGQFDRVLSATEVLGSVKEFKAEQSLLNRRSHLLGVSGFIRAGKLEMTWAYSVKVHKRATIECLAFGFMEALKTLIAHCQSPDAIGHTPSDFSAARLSQKQLDKFLAKINKISDQ
ncbi:non-ribosomal peptide synthetase [Scytonema hofmannii PCC 7110]|uniref:Non-ribosomal peptide synthetase n=1 Tax=Scytonema hofmannii PCC 7110 TaxID=128403 RepID=A0A139XDD5_9CYAN|nr:non-ribosomal peptide synthetase [Scytonema hofmannii]KYC42721.1 non-ribosomal peptide synthetase [Scytonema hofmannii PCC 7110]